MSRNLFSAGEAARLTRGLARTRNLERRFAAALMWVTVGTPGVDGVDALIAENPAPYAASPIAFTNGSCDPDHPVQFTHDPATGLTHVVGIPTGLSAGDECFPLPLAYRPAEDEELISRGTPPALSVAFWTVQASDGAVIFDGEGVVT